MTGFQIGRWVLSVPVHPCAVLARLRFIIEGIVGNPFEE